MQVQSDRLVITPERRSRQGWEGAFRAAGSSAQDELLLENLPANKFDRDAWQYFRAHEASANLAFSKTILSAAQVAP